MSYLGSVQRTKMVMDMKKIIETIQRYKKLLLGTSTLLGVILFFTNQYSLAFLFIFPILFFGVNDYLATKADIPKYVPMSRKHKKEDMEDNNEQQNYSSYRAELFNSVRNRKKK